MAEPTQAQTAISTCSNSKILASYPPSTSKSSLRIDIWNDLSRSTGTARLWSSCAIPPSARVTPQSSSSVVENHDRLPSAPRKGVHRCLCCLRLSRQWRVWSAPCAPWSASCVALAGQTLLMWRAPAFCDAGNCVPVAVSGEPDPRQGFKEARRPRTRVQPGRVDGVRRTRQERRFRRLP